MDAETTRPATPTLTGPGEVSDDSTPQITWTSSRGAASYELYVADLDARQVVLHEKNLLDTSFTMPQLAGGRQYRAWVIAVNDAEAYSDWSDPRDFRIQADRPADHVLYVNFDGIRFTAQELVQLSNGEWHRNPNGTLDIDPEFDGIHVQGLTTQHDREQVIESVIARVQQDLDPFNIEVQRITTMGPVGVGATTLFVGRSDIAGVQNSSSGVAASVDFGNDNLTDIAFVQDHIVARGFGDGSFKAIVNGLAHIALHEAGHTYGLFHVNTTQGHHIHQDAMGFAYTVQQQGSFQRYPQWEDVEFKDHVFGELTKLDEQGRVHDIGVPNGRIDQQNSFRTMEQNFSGPLAERRQRMQGQTGGFATGHHAHVDVFGIPSGEDHIHDHDEALDEEHPEVSATALIGHLGAHLDRAAPQISSCPQVANRAPHPRSSAGPDLELWTRLDQASETTRTAAQRGEAFASDDEPSWSTSVDSLFAGPSVGVSAMLDSRLLF